jgi:hypothetical protein
MLQPQFPSVKCLTGQVDTHSPILAVSGVADYGMADIGSMDANLMGATGF